MFYSFLRFQSYFVRLRDFDCILVVFLELGVFWSFLEVSRVFCLFFRFQWYFCNFQSFGYCGYFAGFGGVLVIF